MKICTKCKKEKSYEDFYIKTNSKDGRNSWCKLCTKENGRKDYQEKKELYLQRAKKNYNQQERRLYMIEYKEQNYDKIRTYQNTYHKTKEVG